MVLDAELSDAVDAVELLDEVDEGVEVVEVVDEGLITETEPEL